jgi:hypothetical protein
MSINAVTDSRGILLTWEASLVPANASPIVTVHPAYGNAPIHTGTCIPNSVSYIVPYVAFVAMITATPVPLKFSVNFGKGVPISRTIKFGALQFTNANPTQFNNVGSLTYAPFQGVASSVNGTLRIHADTARRAIPPSRITFAPNASSMSAMWTDVAFSLREGVFVASFVPDADASMVLLGTKCYWYGLNYPQMSRQLGITPISLTCAWTPERNLSVSWVHAPSDIAKATMTWLKIKDTVLRKFNDVTTTSTVLTFAELTSVFGSVAALVQDCQYTMLYAAYGNETVTPFASSVVRNVYIPRPNRCPWCT